MAAPVLVLAVGNESRGDDGLGPLLLRALQDESGDGGDGIEFLEEFQLQVEHALDLAGRQLVLFVDAGIDTPAPFAFYRAEASATPLLYSHAMAPEALLGVCGQINQAPPPAAFILCVRGEQFELGEGLSRSAVTHLAAVLAFGRRLLQLPEIDAWERLCTQSAQQALKLRTTSVPA